MKSHYTDSIISDVIVTVANHIWDFSYETFVVTEQDLTYAFFLHSRLFICGLNCFI